MLGAVLQCPATTTTAAATTSAATASTATTTIPSQASRIEDLSLQWTHLRILYVNGQILGFTQVFVKCVHH